MTDIILKQPKFTAFFAEIELFLNSTPPINDHIMHMATNDETMGIIFPSVLNEETNMPITSFKLKLISPDARDLINYPALSPITDEYSSDISER